MTFDVVVVGGGPGGCAAAIALRAHAPGLSVALLEATAYDRPRVGETLPPSARRVLAHLGVWDAFAAAGHREVFGTAAAWGSPLPTDDDFLFRARGHQGWHLDRAAFDALLAAQAERRGVRVLRSTRVVSVARAGSRATNGGTSGDEGRWVGDIVESVGATRRNTPDERWRLTTADGEEIAARVVVDATGAGAVVARRCGARHVVDDRLTGFARFFREARSSDGRTLVEAFEGGWWYTAGLPGRRRIAVCMTDGDLARSLGVGEPSRWPALLEEAPAVRALLDGAEAEGGLVVRAARSRRLEPAAGEDWIAVGDAASSFDPLSSQGMLKAMRGGIFAAYAVGDLLARGDAQGMERYRRFVAGEFAAYLRTRGDYYRQERRWPDAPFWSRRHTPSHDEPPADPTRNEGADPIDAVYDASAA